jgi:hypothetical protein
MSFWDTFINDLPEGYVTLDWYVAFMVLGIMLMIIGPFIKFGHGHSTTTLFGVSGPSIINLSSPIPLIITGTGAFFTLYSAVLLVRRMKELKAHD